MTDATRATSQDDPQALALGLRAASEEAGRSEIGHSLQLVATDLESGGSVEDAIERHRSRLAPDVVGAIAAAAHSPDITKALFDILELKRDGRSRIRRLWLQISYPFGILCFSIGVFCALQLTVVRQFGQMFEEFGLNIPMITQVTLWWAHSGAWMLIGMTIVLCAIVLFAWLMAPRPGWHRLLGGFPLIGPVFRRAGHSEATYVLSMLVEHEVPLPNALQLAGDCCTNRDVARIWQGLCKAIESGVTLAQAVTQQSRIPAETIPFMDWGEKTHALPAALRSSSELLAAQSDDSSMQLLWLLPPVVFAFAVVVIVATTLSLFIPLVSLVQALV